MKSDQLSAFSQFGNLRAVAAGLNLSKPLVARHLDPGLSGNSDKPTLSIDHLEEAQRKINTDLLFSYILTGKVLGNILPTLSLLRDLFNILNPTSFLAHKSSLPVWLISIQIKRPPCLTKNPVGMLPLSITMD